MYGEHVLVTVALLNFSPHVLTFDGHHGLAYVVLTNAINCVALSSVTLTILDVNPVFLLLEVMFTADGHSRHDRAVDGNTIFSLTL